VIRPRGRKDVLVAIFLVAGLALGVGLVVLGSEDSDAPSAPSTTAEAEDQTPVRTATPGVTLPLSDLSEAAVSELSGLVFPADMSEFLTAKLDTDTQLDVTFVMPAASTAAFVADSGLPAPTADERLILHSSPLWKLNPDEGTTLSSTQGDAGGVHRVVELIGDDSENIRVRVVVTPT
jgi:hypothetical protein